MEYPNPCLTLPLPWVALRNHVPHGLSNAMLLPCVTEFSIPDAPERYADCARAMGIANEKDSTDIANDKLLNELHALNDELKVPTPEQFGIK